MKRSHVMIPFVALLMCLVGVSPARAQSPSRMEAGALLSVLRLGDFEGVNSGVGGRISYDLSTWLTAEGEVTFFPQESVTWNPSGAGQPGYRLSYTRRRTEALFGVKTGWRGERVGVFAKVRPGFTRLTHKGVGCGGEVCALILIALPIYRMEFAADLGGVVEVYPSARTVARFDVGDLLIRQRSGAPPCSNCVTHNFSTRVGMGWRF